MEAQKAVTIQRLTRSAVGSEIVEWLKDRKNRRAIPHRMEKCGYVPLRNSGAQDGLFKESGSRMVIYVQKTLSLADQMSAAQELTSQ